MASAVVRWGIPAIALALLVLFVVATGQAERRLGATRSASLGRAVLAGGGLTIWMTVLAMLALAGALDRFDRRPPPMLALFAGTIALGLSVGLSRFGERLSRGLPLAALIGFQAFRLPLELVMHRAARDGLMPRVMSFEGYNYDIVSGITAAVLGLWSWLGEPPRVVVWLWSVFGSLLLAAITFIAAAATPVFALFGPGELNVWVTRFPYVWMAVMLGMALLGHVLVFRRLALRPVAPGPAPCSAGTGS